MNQRGFILIELFIVVAIIGILAAVGISNYQQIINDNLKPNITVSITNKSSKNMKLICDTPINKYNNNHDIICRANIGDEDIDYACMIEADDDTLSIHCF